MAALGGDIRRDRGDVLHLLPGPEQEKVGSQLSNIRFPILL